VNCRKINNSLSAYVDGELTGVEHQLIQKHLQECLECREEFEGIVQMKRLLSNVKVQTPRPELAGRILETVHAEPARSFAERSMSWNAMFAPSRRLWAGASLAGMALLAFLAFSNDPNEIRWTSAENQTPLASTAPLNTQDSAFYTPRTSGVAPVANSYLRYSEPSSAPDAPRLAPQEDPLTNPRTHNRGR
jgi:predicted anti-sigma-YlaC factor YlaD